MRELPRPASRAGSSTSSRARSTSSNATDPAAPPRAMVMNDAPRAGRAARLHPGQPGPARQGRPAAVPAVARRARPTPVPEGQRPARAGPGDRRPEEPADGPGAGQPRLAAGTSARGWSTRPATSACGATRRAIPSCSTTWPASSSPTAGRSRRCTGGSCSRAPIGSAATLAARRAAARPGEPPGLAVQSRSGSTSRRCATRSWRSPAASTRRSAAGRSRSPKPPFSDAPHGLRLHRPPEPRRPVPHLRLRRARRHQPAAVRHDRAAAGPVPDEQPVPARAGPPAGRDDPRRERFLATRSGRRSAGSIAACSLRRPRARRAGDGRRSSSAARPDRRLRRRAGLEAARRRQRPRPRCRPGSSLRQVLLLTNEFMFVD